MRLSYEKNRQRETEREREEKQAGKTTKELYL